MRSPAVVAAPGAFAGVVEQQGKAQQCKVFDLRVDVGEATPREVYIAGELGKFFNGDERVFVDGVAMVEVRNHQAGDGLPFRKHR